MLATLALAACSREKVQPADSDKTADALTPEQQEMKRATDYKARQKAFADSVLGSSASLKQVASKLGSKYEVGSVKMRDSLVTFVGRTPQCFKQGRDLDPYLAGTVTFRVHMSVIGSDVVSVQESNWTSPAGNVVDHCFNDEAKKWKFPMGMAKQGMYLLQVQFKP